MQGICWIHWLHNVSGDSEFIGSVNCDNCNLQFNKNEQKCILWGDYVNILFVAQHRAGHLFLSAGLAECIYTLH